MSLFFVRFVVRAGLCVDVAVERISPISFYICVPNNESVTMFVYKKNPVGIKLFSHVKIFFYSKQFAKLLKT